MRSTAGSRWIISRSTRARSCCRRRTIATISCGEPCGECRRSGAGCRERGLRAVGWAHRHNAAEPGYAAFVERLDREPIGYTNVERVQFLLERRAAAELVGPDLVCQRQPIGADAKPEVVSDRAGDFRPADSRITLVLVT